ncbi:MAG: nucleoside kinase [Clostridia bacterium]|nr:nucleoside kinase [Clostridia bacterium]
MAINYDISYINSEMSADPTGFIAMCERTFRQSVETVAAAAYRERRRIVMLAGPSSSGKTTTAALFDAYYRRQGGRAYVVSLDDFYYDNGTGPKNPDGSDDYESVWALDVPHLTACMRQLAAQGRASLPLFDFTTGKRRAETRDIALEQNDMLIVEGLHALNPVITDALPPEALCLVYISVSSRIADEKGIYLNKRDLRFVRRMIRDAQFRASPPENTFRLWRHVLTGEDAYLFPFEDRAQYRIDSLHPYEPCALAQAGIRLLQTVPHDSVYAKNAALLAQKLAGFVTVNTKDVPQDSLLREFLGNL